MRLTLTVVDPRDGNSADVVLDADPESLVGEVARVLEHQLGGEGTGSAPSVYVDGRVLDPATSLARSPLKEGSVVSLHTPAGCPPREVTGIVELRVAGGPDAGAVHRLGLGRTDIGRGAAAHVRVDDPELAERALTLTVGPDGRCTVRGHDADERITLDGVQLRERADSAFGRDGSAPVEWPLDSQLAVGGSLLELVAYRPPDADLRPSEDGTGFAFERPARLFPSEHRRRPSVPEPVRGSWSSERPRALYAPAVMALLAAVVCSTVFGRWYWLLGLLSPVFVVIERRAGNRFRAQNRAVAEAAQDGLGVEIHHLRRAAPSPAAVLSLATGPRARLWERRPGDHDHLLLRVGTGPTDVAPGGWALKDTIEDAPVTLPLRELGVIGLAGPGDSARALGRWAVAQIAALHSPLDVSVQVLTVKGAHDSWDWLRWLPHARPFGGVDANVAIGTDAETVGARIGELVRLLNDRKRARETGGNAEAFAPDIVIVCDGSRQLSSLPGMVYLLREGPAAGIRMLCLDEEERFLPGECQAIVLAEPRGGSPFRDPWRASAQVVADHPERDTRSALRLRVLWAESRRVRDVRPDFVSAAWCGHLARSLAPLRDASGETVSLALPAQTRLLDVLRLEPPTGQAVADRWTSGGPSAFAVIGETYDGPFGIDLRRDGPHALIAGTSGSGKSELLQTIIASLAVANSPEHLTFVLIDYRGGAAFRSCVRLPHTVGTVTDLDPYLVQRVLNSFAAELKRREHLLASAGAKDIYDYHDLLRRTPGEWEPLPRLVIVIDEIASMARELPDFITGVINVAQRGRPLGVHLVLATQRPSGVISAEIRANTNLRIALRVTESGESHDIVDSPEAAVIPRSLPGRGYARFGHASLIPFQSGRVGGLRLSAAGSGYRAPWAAPLTWPDLGRAALAAPRTEPARGAAVTTDLDALVDAVRDAHTALAVPPQHSPWLPPLPEILLLDEIGPAEAEESEARPGALPPVAFGAEDLPAEQRRRPVRIDFAHFGHLLIGGAPRSGRSQVLRTIAGALARAHSCADVHLYGIDCGHNGLSTLAELPHCGALVSRRETERAARLLSRLTDELRRRQDRGPAMEEFDISDQRGRVEAARRLPYLVVLLDGWEGWQSTLGEYDHGRLTDELLVLMREGAAVGIHFVITGDRQVLAGRIASLTEEKYALRLTDRSDYSLLGVRPGDVPESMPAGRAVRAGHGSTETQFALLTEGATEQAQAEALAATGVAAASRDAAVPRERRPFRVEPLPGRIGFDEAWKLRDPEGSRSRLWTLAGVGGDEIRGYGPDLADGVPAFVIAGPPKSGRSTALLSVARSCLSQGVRLVVAAPRPSPLRELAGQAGVLAVFTGTDILEDEFDRAVDSVSPERPIAVIVDDAELLAHCDAEPSLKLLIQHGAESGLALVLGGDEKDVCSGYSGWQFDAKRARRGLLLSPQESSSGDLIGLRIGRSSVGYPVQPGRGVLHLGDGRLLSVLIPSG
ncbi:MULTISPECIES: FtsK/SpoIIIE domain-containing protein [Streptomyces]|uniref:Cell division protein FtsK n=1 Tax=Streptomyces dengpaensis TaxID=2049881 RepID=A0ABM6SNL7_9ACTN|nr:MULTISPECIES: FtsK/SpoIIIE domain-containing protein [Streptomyces]AVH55918.1 cell division protein FtsK [Streptomyces dengpaensis]PIB12169.1 cell division protein FtsK [Streptomyces sp. HG99]